MMDLLMRSVGAVTAFTLCCLLGACVSPRSTASGAGSDGKDRVTASDESDGSKRARVRMELATAYFGQGQMTTALDQIKLAIAADPNFGEAFNLRGLIYANLGDEALAAESFRRALQINPRDADTMQNYGFFLCRIKRYAEADALFEQALAEPRYQDTVRTLQSQGVCRAHAGQLVESERSLTRAFEIDPSNAATAVNLAEVLYRRGEYERARFYIRRINGQPSVANAQTLWLAMRIENRMGNSSGVQDFGFQLRSRFPNAPETAKYLRGAFDE